MPIAVPPSAHFGPSHIIALTTAPRMKAVAVAMAVRFLIGITSGLPLAG